MKAWAAPHPAERTRMTTENCAGLLHKHTLEKRMTLKLICKHEKQDIQIQMCEGEKQKDRAPAGFCLE